MLLQIRVLLNQCSSWHSKKVLTFFGLILSDNFKLGGFHLWRPHWGGRGVPSKADIVSNLRKGGCVNLRTRGVKKCEIFADVINGSPLSMTHISDTHCTDDHSFEWFVAAVCLRRWQSGLKMFVWGCVISASDSALLHEAWLIILEASRWWWCRHLQEE